MVPLRLSRLAMLAVTLVLLPSCSQAPLYSEVAYQNAVSLKVEALALMEKATEPFSEHSDEVAALRLDLRKAYEFSRGRPKNEISTRQWEILLDSERNLLGGFLARWEEESQLGKAFVAEAKLLVADAFDTISGLESRRIKPDEVK